MKLKLSLAIALLAALALPPSNAFAVDDTPGAVTVSAPIKSKAKLTLTGGAFTFTDVDPDTNPTGSTTVEAKVRTDASADGSLTVAPTAANLSDGTNNISVANLMWSTGGTSGGGTWTAGLTAFNGTNAQTIVSGMGSGTHDGTINWELQNSWDYIASMVNYAVTLQYTLTAP